MKFDIQKDWDLALMGLLAVTTAFNYGNEWVTHAWQMHAFSGVVAYHILKMVKE